MTLSKLIPRSQADTISQVASISPMPGKAITIVTSMILHAEADLIWDSLMFYEQIEQKPPLLLRLLLPHPVRTEGSKEQVGDVATCVYAQGHLLKQVTRIEAPGLYEFQVIEQHLVFGGGLRLMGGSYALSDVSPDHTKVSVTTRYVSIKKPRRLWKPIEALVCHAFHRYLLLSIQKKALAPQSTTAPVPESILHHRE
jgi:hypothetical protein